PTGPEVGGVGEGGAGGVELRHEGVEAAEGRLEGPRSRREVERPSAARHIGAAGGVHRDAVATITTTAPEVGGVDEGGARGVELRHEGIEEAAEGRLEGPQRRREVDGEGVTRHVGVAGGVHGDAAALVTPTAPDVGGGGKGGAGVDERRGEVV